MNVTEIIAALGGYREAQKLLGVSRPLLSEWELIGIPAKRWDQIALIASMIGRPDVSFEVIRTADPSRQPRRTAA